MCNSGESAQRTARRADKVWRERSPERYLWWFREEVAGAEGASLFGLEVCVEGQVCEDGRLKFVGLAGLLFQRRWGTQQTESGHSTAEQKKGDLRGEVGMRGEDDLQIRRRQTCRLRGAANLLL